MNDSPLKLLLVEDSLGDARILQEVVAESSSPQFVLTHVEQLGDALALLQEKRFDVILTDLSLPDSSGLQALRQIAEHAQDVPIIVLTGLDDEAVALKAVQEGAQDYLIKGQVDTNLLGRAIRYALERHRVRQAVERQRAEFLAVLTHDIKNPLTVILGHADLLLEEAETRGMRESEQEDSLLWIKQGALSVLSLVENYLNLSRIEAGQFTLNKIPLQLNDLLDRVGQQCRAAARQGGITLEVQLEKELPWVEGDRLALERVFANLVSNAVKFTPVGGHITISSAQHGKEVWATVADSGPGIASEELSAIFEKYRRTAATRQQPGTGLGLFIVKALMEAHGGRVTVESTLGAGSRFQVILPAASR